MAKNKLLFRTAQIIGLLVTAFFLIAIIPKLIGDLMENGFDALSKFGSSLINWYDNPTGFFFTYLVGFLIIWKNKLLGAIIILTACLLVTLINLDNMGWIIFTVPAATVAVLFLLYWYKTK